MKPVIVCGDMNVAHTDLDFYGPRGKIRSACLTEEERDSFGSFLEQHKFVDTYRHFYPESMKYSQWSLRGNGRAKDQGLRIDYMLVSQPMVDAIVDSEIHN